MADFQFSKEVVLRAGSKIQDGVDIPLEHPEFMVSLLPKPSREGDGTPGNVIAVLQEVRYLVSWGVGGGGFLSTPVQKGVFDAFVAGSTAEEVPPLPLTGLAVPARGRATVSIALPGSLNPILDGTIVRFLVQAFPGRISNYLVPLLLDTTTFVGLPPFARRITCEVPGATYQFDPAPGDAAPTIDTAGNVVPVDIPPGGARVRLDGPVGGTAHVECWS